MLKRNPVKAKAVRMIPMIKSGSMPDSRITFTQFRLSSLMHQTVWHYDCLARYYSSHCSNYIIISDLRFQQLSSPSPRKNCLIAETVWHPSTDYRNCMTSFIRLWKLSEILQWWRLSDILHLTQIVKNCLPSPTSSACGNSGDVLFTVSLLCQKITHPETITPWREMIGDHDILILENFLIDFLNKLGLSCAKLSWGQLPAVAIYYAPLCLLV